jgi:hypothetical protein
MSTRLWRDFLDPTEDEEEKKRNATTIGGLLSRLRANNERVPITYISGITSHQRMSPAQQESQMQLKLTPKSGGSISLLERVRLNSAQVAKQLSRVRTLTPKVQSIGRLLLSQSSAREISAMKREFSQLRAQMKEEQEADLESEAQSQINTGKLKQQLLNIRQAQVALQTQALALTEERDRRASLLREARRKLMSRERALAAIPANEQDDPSYRLMLGRSALQAVAARKSAQRWIYRAGRALEYEINSPLGEALERAVLAANNSSEIERLSACYSNVFNEYSAQFGIPQDFTTEISLRSLLGIDGNVTDDTGGDSVSPEELFRRELLKSENFNAAGDLTIEFSTNLDPGNELWSSNVCDDKIVSIRARMLGDVGGDDAVELHLGVSGSGIMRRCDSEEIVSWQIDSADTAVVQAGLADYGKTNTTLYGHSVARPHWTVTIPSASSAPSNRDIDLTKLEDIIIEVSHEALPLGNSDASIPLDCFATVGGL